MKVLLTAINAKYIHSNLAVYALKANAGEYADLVEIGEYTINHSRDYILEEIYKKKPDLLCFSVYIWNLDYVETIAREFHKLCPQVPIWMGGPEVSYETERFLRRHPYVTGLMIGEGEMTFRELCAYYQAVFQKNAKEQCPADAKQSENPESTPTIGDLREIAGLAFLADDNNRISEAEPDPHGDSDRKSSRTYVQTACRQPLNMSRLPFSYDESQDFSNRIIYYESSRGCPFNCSYCLSSVEKHLRFRDPELVKSELTFFMEQKVPQVKFVDRTFNCNHPHAMEIWRFIKEHDNGVTNFHFEIAADLLNEEELALIAEMRPGLIQLEIGVQSTNWDTIQEIHRVMKLDEVKEKVRRIQKGRNIHQHLDLIAGLPYEDYETFSHSFDEIYALKPNQLQLGFLKVLKGSYMYEHAAEYDLLYHDDPPYEVLSTRWLSYEDLLQIKRVEEMLEVYYNSGQFEVTMKVIEVLFDSAFRFFRELGRFYEEKGYLGMSHSRIRRCEILLEFFREWLKARESAEKIMRSEFDQKDMCAGAGRMDFASVMEMLEEALVFDLYYRENCKSRPSWAADPTAFRRTTKEYCRNGKLSHVEPFHYAFPQKEILTIEHLPERLAEPVWVLFEYDKRDPLDHQAATSYVQPVREWGPRER